MANRLMRFVGGPWDGQTKDSSEVYISSEGRVIVKEAWLRPLDVPAIARGEAVPESEDYAHQQTEYALWGDGTWRVKAQDGPLVGRREYDVPPDLKVQADEGKPE